LLREGEMEKKTENRKEEGSRHVIALSLDLESIASQCMDIHGNPNISK